MGGLCAGRARLCARAVAAPVGRRYCASPGVLSGPGRAVSMDPNRARRPGPRAVFRPSRPALGTASSGTVFHGFIVAKRGHCGGLARPAEQACERLAHAAAGRGCVSPDPAAIDRRRPVRRSYRALADAGGAPLGDGLARRLLADERLHGARRASILVVHARPPAAPGDAHHAQHRHAYCRTLGRHAPANRHRRHDYTLGPRPISRVSRRRTRMGHHGRA